MTEPIEYVSGPRARCPVCGREATARITTRAICELRGGCPHFRFVEQAGKQMRLAYARPKEAGRQVAK